MGRRPGQQAGPRRAAGIVAAGTGVTAAAEPTAVRMSYADAVVSGSEQPAAARASHVEQQSPCADAAATFARRGEGARQAHCAGAVVPMPRSGTGTIPAAIRAPDAEPPEVSCRHKHRIQPSTADACDCIGCGSAPLAW